VIVRAATLEDAPVIAELERHLFGVDAWSTVSVLEELEPPRFAVVAVDADLVGYAITSRSGDVVDLRRIAVRATHRRRGVAHDLLAASRVAADGSERMLLEVSATNTGALAFYAAEGFAEIDRRRRYYRDGSDAVVMARRLVASSRTAQ
jgi:[ribosomal protein S18]-alanine N-acetyltransferase